MFVSVDVMNFMAGELSNCNVLRCAVSGSQRLCALARNMFTCRWMKVNIHQDGTLHKSHIHPVLKTISVTREMLKHNLNLASDSHVSVGQS
jgi:hypothetical protein